MPRYLVELFATLYEQHYKVLKHEDSWNYNEDKVYDLSHLSLLSPMCVSLILSIVLIIVPGILTSHNFVEMFDTLIRTTLQSCEV